MSGLYFGGVYFGEYAPAIAAPPAPAPVVLPFRVVGEPWPGRARKTELRRGWRWHRARYDVLHGARVLGSAFNFADALGLALERGGDLIRRRDPANPLREVRRWYGAELERALAKFRRRLL